MIMGSYWDNLTSHLSHSSTLSSHLTLIIGQNFALVILHLHIQLQNLAKFCFFTLNKVVLSGFPNNLYMPPNNARIRMANNHFIPAQTERLPTPRNAEKFEYY